MTPTAMARGSNPCAVDDRRRIETTLLGAALLLLNLPLFFGRSVAALSWQGNSVAAGEWWRLFTHPFVHVSWYHFLLDGAAFLMLYAQLPAGAWWRRAVWVACTAAGSLVVALACSPQIAAHGLCGLSGVAHGLMAVSALELLKLPEADRTTRAFAWASLSAVSLKCIVEAGTGHPFFHVLHFGLLGVPIVECHAGGVLGGLLGALLLPSRASTTCVQGALFPPAPTV